MMLSVAKKRYSSVLMLPGIVNSFMLDVLVPSYRNSQENGFYFV